MLGPDHPQTLGARNNLANSYADLGRHEEALELRLQVLDGRERVLGPDHPHTLTAGDNLASSYAGLGDAEPQPGERLPAGRTSPSGARPPPSPARVRPARPRAAEALAADAPHPRRRAAGLSGHGHAGRAVGAAPGGGRRRSHPDDARGWARLVDGRGAGCRRPRPSPPSSWSR